MSNMLGKLINAVLLPLNIKICRVKVENKNIIYPVEASERDIEIINYILRFDNTKEAISMVSIERLWAVIQATKYIVKNNIKGDFVECGVWRGGCSLAMAMVLNDLKSERRLLLFDTFEGMTKPTNDDLGRWGNNPLEKFLKSQNDNHNEWCYASLEEVKDQFKKLSLDRNITFIKGDVLKTLNNKKNLPEKIALLRLDTDWYESTKVEINTLYPILEKNGILLIDDYGHWQGCRKAIDEYLEDQGLKDQVIMWKTDETGRSLIKNQLARSVRTNNDY